LILHAYHVWGEDCAEHLLGDFAFAIWDSRNQTLFCARDQLGVKPFYYAMLGERLVFSNTLRCVQLYPAVSQRLNDLAIADFLLFEANQDPHTTTFSDIKRLPPGTSLVFNAAGSRLRRYWTPPREITVRYRQRRDYVEHFRELLELAVADRLRARHVGVDMSGGLDSPSIAAVALQHLRRDPRPFSLHAHTVVYDRLIPDEERHYAGLVAEHLGIPIHFHVGDDWEPFEHANEPGVQGPEPVHEPHLAMCDYVARRRASLARICLTGFDGDSMLVESPKPYFRVLVRQRRYARLLWEVSSYAARERRLPHGLKARLSFRKADAEARPAAGYPRWISPELETRFDLRARWERAQRPAMPAHPVRPYAHAILEYITQRTRFFESFDPEYSQVAAEYRHPLMDLRLWEYCLSLPPMPWCVRKTILRQSMVGLLPRAILERPKTPLAGLPCLAALQARTGSWVDDFRATGELQRYVARQHVPRVCDERSPGAAWQNLRPLSLNLWMQSSENAKEDEP
jgi:asparagine synthase (glutamine-hydrolysing)